MASNGWRDLGYLESYCAECHARCNGAFQVVGIAELGGVVDPDLMRDALAMLYQRHPLLRAALRRGSTAWSFIEGAPFAAVPLAIRPYQDADDWQRVAEAELGLPLQTDRNLWRATLLDGGSSRPGFLVLTGHHAILDGLSLLSLVRQFVAAYLDIAAGRAPERQARPLLPCVERLLASHVGTSVSAPQALPEVTDDACWPFEAFAPFDARIPRVRFRELEGDDLARLIERCHVERTTVGGALFAAAVEAAFALPEPAPSAPIYVAHDVRRECAVTEEDLGVFICGVNLVGRRSDERGGFWDRARALEDQYRSALPGALRQSPDFVLDDVAATVSAYRDAEARRFSSGFVLSDLGPHAGGPAGGALRLESFRGLTCNAGGVMAVMVFVTTVGDRMDCAFAYHEPLLSVRSVDAYADAMLARLRAETT